MCRTLKVRSDQKDIQWITIYHILYEQQYNIINSIIHTIVCSSIHCLQVEVENMSKNIVRNFNVSSHIHNIQCTQVDNKTFNRYNGLMLDI